MKYFLVILMAVFSAASHAETYQFIIPNPPGSSSDIVARIIQEEYHRISKKKLILDHVPGADHVLAANKFRSQNRLSVILGTTTMHVLNHVYKTDLSYSDQDFSHVSWVGWGPQVWYVRNDSPLKNLADLKKMIASEQKVLIAVDGMSTQINVMSIQSNMKNGMAAEMVKYKGSPQALTDLLGGHVPIGMSSLNEAIKAQAESGKIRVLGTTTEHPISLAGQTIPSASKVWGIPQFNGGFLISVSSTYGNDPETIQLKKDLLEAINSNKTKEKLASILIETDGRGESATTQLLQDYRKELIKLKK